MHCNLWLVVGFRLRRNIIKRWSEIARSDSLQKSNKNVKCVECWLWRATSEDRGNGKECWTLNWILFALWFLRFISATNRKTTMRWNERGGWGLIEFSDCAHILSQNYSPDGGEMNREDKLPIISRGIQSTLSQLIGFYREITSGFFSPTKLNLWLCSNYNFADSLPLHDMR